MCFALVLLTCAAKNYLAVAVRDTALCPYLCPSLLGRDWLVFSLPVLEQLFAWQHALQDALQGLVQRYWSDPGAFATTLAIAPVLEEAIYRGPLYLARGRLRSGLWWLLAGPLYLLITYSALYLSGLLTRTEIGQFLDVINLKKSLRYIKNELNGR